MSLSTSIILDPRATTVFSLRDRDRPYLARNYRGTCQPGEWPCHSFAMPVLIMRHLLRRKVAFQTRRGFVLYVSLRASSFSSSASRASTELDNGCTDTYGEACAREVLWSGIFLLFFRSHGCTVEARRYVLHCQLVCYSSVRKSCFKELADFLLACRTLSEFRNSSACRFFLCRRWARLTKYCRFSRTFLLVNSYKFLIFCFRRERERERK